MTIYSIVLHSDGIGFNIDIVGDDGVRQTMLGFTSEAQAQAWIGAAQSREFPGMGLAD
jgi:hypothetical protein